MNEINKDNKTIEGFGDEWERFNQSNLNSHELNLLFENYFKLFPWDSLKKNSVGFDMGCGSGRWAKLVAPKVGHLHCIDPSKALDIAKKNLNDFTNITFHLGGVGDNILEQNSMDFGYSLGVLHHVPNTSNGIKDCVKMLKPGAPFLLYLYYSFDNKSYLYKMLWKITELGRFSISKLPYFPRYLTSQFIALFIYFPLARISLFFQILGINQKIINKIPLSFYRNLSLYTMRTDSLDRFGTRLEQRFSKIEITNMMMDAGLIDIQFSDITPYWCAVGKKAI
jgi:ubiquinone/menaquinone biosynthesis C-methylase UbiE